MSSEAVVGALRMAPLSMSSRDMQSGLSMVGGDGAVVRGGEGRLLPGTSAAELTWTMAHPELGHAHVEDDAPLAALDDRMKTRIADDRRLWYSTEWDKMHREDKRITRAIAGCPAASNLFDIGRLMDHFFGFGDGRLLLRAAAAVTDTSIRSGALPSITRKGVTLTREPGHLLDNLPAYAVAMGGKVALRREHRGQYTLQVLVEAGRRLTAVDTVAFATLFKDVLEKAVAPWTAVVQSSSLEPWVLSRRLQHQTATLKGLLSLIRSTRRMVRILVLLRSHASSEDIGRFANALAYADPSRFFGDSRSRDDHEGRRIHELIRLQEPSTLSWGRWLPTFWHSLPKLLDELHPSFRGVELLCEADFTKQGLSCLSPHCQCGFLVDSSQSAHPNRLPMPVALQRRRRRKSAPRSVPSWVVNNSSAPIDAAFQSASWLDDEFGEAWSTQIQKFLQEKDERPFGPLYPEGRANIWTRPSDPDDPDSPLLFKVGAEPGTAPLRYSYREPHPTVPLGVSGRWRFREHLRPQAGGVISRCRVDPRLPALLEDIDNALRQTTVFIRALETEGAKLYGSEGYNAGMERALRAMNYCFDWVQWVERRPTRRCVEEFGVLCEMLQPLLRQTTYPSQTDFPDVPHAWPDNKVLPRASIALSFKINLHNFLRFPLPGVLGWVCHYVYHRLWRATMFSTSIGRCNESSPAWVGYHLFFHRLWRANVWATP